MIIKTLNESILPSGWSLTDESSEHENGFGYYTYTNRMLGIDVTIEESRNGYIVTVTDRLYGRSVLAKSTVSDGLSDEDILRGIEDAISEYSDACRKTLSSIDIIKIADKFDGLVSRAEKLGFSKYITRKLG